MAKKKNINSEMMQDLRNSVMRDAMRNSFFADIDPRRRQEVAEGGMLNEDHRAVSNLPENFIHEEYPRSLRHNGLGFPDVRNFMRGRSAIDDDYEME